MSIVAAAISQDIANSTIDNTGVAGQAVSTDQPVAATVPALETATPTPTKTESKWEKYKWPIVGVVIAGIAGVVYWVQEKYPQHAKWVWAGFLISNVINY